MKIQTLEKALALQQRAYRMLLWLGGEAKRSSEILDGEPFSTAASTERWIKRFLNRFPGDVRPDLDDVGALAFALASFFATSFHLEKGPDGAMRLVRGAKKFTDRRNKKYAIQHAQNNAFELKQLALTALAAEENIAVDNVSISKLVADAKFADALTVWTYGCEMVRRSEFASQGPAVHQLWLELSEKQRTQLSAESIWKARNALVKSLKT